jgi:hypothetical protein
MDWGGRGGGGGAGGGRADKHTAPEVRTCKLYDANCRFQSGAYCFSMLSGAYRYLEGHQIPVMVLGQFEVKAGRYDFLGAT